MDLDDAKGLFFKLRLCSQFASVLVKVKGKDIPVTGHGGP
jgi:hypothetical protein